MKEFTPGSAWSMSHTRAAAVGAFFVLSLAVYGVRILSVWRYGTLFSATAVEAPMIDSVSRCMHHGTVYTSPFTFPFSLSLYNYLFYYSYAGSLRAIGAWDAGILTWGRQFTLLFALSGAIAQWQLVRSVLNLRGIASAGSLALAAGLWLCTSLVKYWAISIRPDMAAAALVMIALWIVVRQPRFAFAYAGLLLYLAWAFKQSVVLAFLGLCIWLLLNKRWKDLTLLVAVFAALVSVTLLFGSPAYRFSILVAPEMVRGFTFGPPWILHALGTGLNAIFLNLYWVAAPFILLWASHGKGKLDAGVRMLLIVFVVALIFGIAGMGKVGGTSNYLLEAFAAGSTLLQLAVFTVPGRCVTAFVFFGCIQPAVQLVGVGIGYHAAGRHDMAPIATAAEYADAVALRNQLSGMKKPIFTTDGAFSLPWIAAENGAPSIVLDPNFQQVAEPREQNGGVEGMLQRGEIPTVMLASTDHAYMQSLNPGYRKVGESVQQGVHYTIYAFSPTTRAPQSAPKTKTPETLRPLAPSE
jgi:hypothetical protein